MKLIALCIATAALLLPAGTVLAQDGEAQPGGGQSSIVELAGAYQGGYLQVVSICGFQLYNTLGIIHSDLVNGVIDPPTALSSLEYNSLLQSACHTSLEDIRALTPVQDTMALAELEALQGIMTAEGELIRALIDFASEPSDAHYAAADSARRQVETLLDAYVNQDGGESGDAGGSG